MLAAFFFQAEDGIRDHCVTGVQTCALPILDHEVHNGGWRRIVIEKPFGRDLDSAKRLNREMLKVFRESQVYRIDHYLDRKSTRLNSSHTVISYAVFCLKKKKEKREYQEHRR